MGMQLSKKDLKTVQNLVGKIRKSFNDEQMSDEKLVQFYLNEIQGSTKEEAENVVKGLHNGIRTFNDTLQQALSENGFDYREELGKLTIDMQLVDKYNLYLDFLAVISTLDMENMTDQISEIEKYEEMRKRWNPNCEVTESMLSKLEEKIAEVLDNNTLCLGSVEALRDIVAKIPEGEEAIESAIHDREEKVKEELILAMATYICHKQGSLESVNCDEFTPEMAAVIAAMGVEQANVLGDLSAGRTTVDKAIHILKTIGGVALYALLTIGVFILLGMMAVFAMAMLQSVIGTSILATIISAIFGFYVALELEDWVSSIPEKVTNTASRLFDVVVKTWREKMWPGIKDVYEKVREWLGRHLLPQNDVVTGPIVVND